MRLIYLISILILVVNYIFFIDSYSSDIDYYQKEIEKLSFIEHEKSALDETKDVLELTGVQIIERLEREILLENLSTKSKSYSQSKDEEGYKIHELSFVLEGNEREFRNFVQRDIFAQEYKLQNIEIYQEDEKEIMKILLLVQSL